MKVRVDAAGCMGHGMCAMRAAEVYVLNDDGFNDMADFEVGPERQAAAVRGALACPERIITVTDEDGG